MIFVHWVDSRFAQWDDKAESTSDKNDNEIEDTALLIGNYNGTMKEDDRVFEIKF